ncbi:60S ribosomal protein L10P, insertion domain, partial [Dillenia turbinata]
TLSKSRKKGKEYEESSVNLIRQPAEDYNFIFVFTFEKMRNLKFKEFKEQLKSSCRFFLGTKKVMQVSLGRCASDEIRPGLHKVYGKLQWHLPVLAPCFIIHIGDFYWHYMRIANSILILGVYDLWFAVWILLCNGYSMNLKNLTLRGQEALLRKRWNEGPLEHFTYEMQPFLRKQGMPVLLNKGVVELVSDFVVGEEGKPLSPESAQILHLLGINMATFRLNLLCRWSPEYFEVYNEGLESA